MRSTVVPEDLLDVRLDMFPLLHHNARAATLLLPFAVQDQPALFAAAATPGIPPWVAKPHTPADVLAICSTVMGASSGSEWKVRYACSWLVHVHV